jgi:DNA-binding response OmpR family regulator
MRKIIFVDDDQKVIQKLKKQLYPMRFEWKMEFAGSGKDALEFMEKSSYDVVVSDMLMPDIYGYDVIKAINALDKRPKIGIITGWVEELKPVTSRELNVDFIMKKPFEFSELTKHINEITSSA